MPGFRGGLNGPWGLPDPCGRLVSYAGDILGLVDGLRGVLG